LGGPVSFPAKVVVAHAAFVAVEITVRKNPRSNACDKLFAAATPPGGSAPTDTLPAAQNIARYPWYEPERLFALLDVFYPVPSGKAWQIRSNTNVSGLRFRRAQVENPDEIPRPKFRTEDKLNLDNALRRTSLRWKFQARPQHTTQFSSESMTFLKP